MNGTTDFQNMSPSLETLRDQEPEQGSCIVFASGSEIVLPPVEEIETCPAQGAG